MGISISFQDLLWQDIYIFVVIVYFRVNIDLVNCTTVIHCILLVIRAIHHRPVNTL